MRLAPVLCRVLLHSLLPSDACSSSSLSTTVIKFSIDMIMKAILFVILNVSVCFPRGSVGVEILIPGGFGGVERKKFSRLAIARHDPPASCNTPLIFTLLRLLYPVHLPLDLEVAPLTFQLGMHCVYGCR